MIKIRGLKINNEIVDGNYPFDANPAKFVASGYINLVDLENNKAKAALLEGHKDQIEYKSINLCLDKEFTLLTELEADGLAPKGYAQRETNATVFATFEMGVPKAGVFETNEGEVKSFMTATLSDIRYLKVNDTVLTPRVLVGEIVEAHKSDEDLVETSEAMTA